MFGGLQKHEKTLVGLSSAAQVRQPEFPESDKVYKILFFLNVKKMCYLIKGRHGSAKLAQLTFM